MLLQVADNVAYGFDLSQSLVRHSDAQSLSLIHISPFDRTLPARVVEDASMIWYDKNTPLEFGEAYNVKLKNPVLVVTDIEKTVAFYKKVLGLHVVMDFGANKTLTRCV